MRCCSIGLFGTLLKGVKELNKHTVREDVFRSTVPLLIQLGDPWTKEVHWGHGNRGGRLPCTEQRSLQDRLAIALRRLKVSRGLDLLPSSSSRESLAGGARD